MSMKKKGFAGFIFMLLITMMMALPVSAASSSAKLNKTTATVRVGNTVQLKVKNTSKKVKWSSSKTKVATVNSKGLVTAKKAGTTTIKAKVGSKTLKCKVTVKANEWTYPNKLSSTSSWTNLGTCNQNKAWALVYARPAKLSYNSKGQLTGTIAVLNKTPSRNYELNTMKVTLKKPDGTIIAEQSFPINSTIISPNTYAEVHVTFNKSNTKKVVDLSKGNWTCSISTN